MPTKVIFCAKCALEETRTTLSKRYRNGCAFLKMTKTNIPGMLYTDALIHAVSSGSQQVVDLVSCNSTLRPC